MNNFNSHNLKQKIVNSTLTFLIKRDRFTRRSLILISDVVFIFLSLLCSMALHLETFEFLNEPIFYLSYVVVTVLTIGTLKIVGLYRSMFRYVSTEVVMLVLIGSAISFLLLIITKFFFASFMPWQVPITYTAFLFISINALRFSIRSLLRTNFNGKTENVAVYGAGEAGAQLIQSLNSKQRYKVKFIIDDDKNIQGSNIFGIKVISFSDASEKFDELGVKTVLLAIPSASVSEKKIIIQKLFDFSLMVKSIPSINSLIDGSEKIHELKSIEIEDLLGRRAVEPDSNLHAKNIFDKTVIVTGAGGTIGSELSRQILEFDPDHLILIDISETAIYYILQDIEILAMEHNVKLSPYVGSVNDRPFIQSILDNNKVHTIYHAAAYKHVPLMEYNVKQAIKNNSFGTLVLAEEAVRAKVSNFTLISTDKAVNPTNIMGASKRLAELICQSFNKENKITKFTIVRFGNVLGSSGSVVPLFKRQIAEGGPVTLTHREVSRYFMTINEAVELVIQACELSDYGVIFILDMGEPVKIIDLAKKMIYLSGSKPFIDNSDEIKKGDIEIRISGLRPGEKIHEELYFSDDLVNTKHPKIKSSDEEHLELVKIKEIISELGESIKAQNIHEIKNILSKYASYSDEADSNK